MKQTLTTLFLLLSLAGFSQNTPGVYVSGAFSSNNYERNQRMLINADAELGYQSKVIGVYGTYHVTVNANQASSAGLKLSANLFTWQGITGSVGAEAATYIKPIDHKIRKDFEYRFTGRAIAQILPGVYGFLEYQKLAYNQLLKGDEITKGRNGYRIGAAVRLWK